jgi:hypothetical protein
LPGVTDPSQERSVQPKVSPDGKWVWDGHNWVENPHPAPPQRIPEYPAPFTPAAPPEPPEVAPRLPPPTPGGPTTIAPTPPWTPPKRSNTLRNIVLSCAVLVILMVAGCTVFVTVAVNQVGKAVDKQVARAGGDGSQGQTATVEAGAGFTLDGLRYQPGWRFAENQIGMLEVRRLRFENTRDDEATVVLRLELLRGGDVAATVHCTSNQVRPGTVGRLSCLGADPRPAQYDEVRVTDLF